MDCGYMPLIYLLKQSSFSQCRNALFCTVTVGGKILTFLYSVLAGVKQVFEAGLIVLLEHFLIYNSQIDVGYQLLVIFFYRCIMMKPM